ncbi:MAG: hypothetical protein BWY28_02429 [bacterium ADurb.Bin236]|nr:MAG: hypothetical protein BWY28_02429 [bacterium ADurb.Bin236]
MTVSRNQFDETKNWTEPEWQEGVPVMDADLNLAMKISKTGLRRAVCDFLGNGSPNDGFKLSGLATDPLIHAGDIWIAGLKLELSEDVHASEQPNAPVAFPNGNGIWFIDTVEQLMTNAEDPAIRDYRLPANVETPVKVWKTDWTLRKAIGASLPTPEPDHYYLGIAIEAGGVLTDIRNTGMILAGADTGYQNRVGGRPGSGHRHKDEDIDVQNPNYTGDTLEEVLNEIDSRIDVVQGGIGVVTPHAATHGAGGSDQVNIANLSGQCTQAQVSPAHSGLHTASFNGGLPVSPDVNGNASIGAHLADTAIHRKNHNDLLSMQGGTPTERYHLALDLYNAAIGAAGANASNPFATLGDLSGVAAKFASPVQTVQNLRDIAAANRSDKQVRLVEDKGSLYRFDETATGADDGDGIIAPTSGTGRWFKMSSAVPDLSTVLAKGNSAGNKRITELLNPQTGTDAATMDWVLGKIGAGGGTAQAAWIVMDPAGAPGTYSDLQQAVNALGSGGGIIWVKPGTYTLNSHVTMKHNTILYGLGSMEEGVPDVMPTFVPSAGFSDYCMLQASPGNKFLNLWIKVPKNSIGISPYRYYGSRLDVDGCFIEAETTDFGSDFYATTIGIGGEWGVWGQEIMNGKIRNCVFRRLRHGIYCELNSNTVIEYNRFQGVSNFRYELDDVIYSAVNQGSNQFRATSAVVNAGLIAVGMTVGFSDGTNSDYKTVVDVVYDSMYGFYICTVNSAFQHGYDGSPGQSFYSQPPSSGITAGDNTHETFICFNYFDGGGNGYLDINAVRNSDTNIGLLNAYIIGNTSETLFVGTDKPTVKLQTSPYSFSGGDILFLGNTFAGQIFVDGSNTVAFICCDNNIGSIDATDYEGRVVFNNNLCHGSVKLKNAATASGNYVMGNLQVISGTTEKTLAVGNYVESGMTLAGDYSVAANNVIEDGGLSVGGKGSRASGNSVRGTLTLGFWGSATGNVIRTNKQVAISAIVPRAQIAGNACLDEFNIKSEDGSQKFYATGTSCTFYTAGHVDNFQPGYCVTFQSSKDIETRMITGVSGNTISWADPLNSSYGGTSNTAWAYTNLAHIDGVSSLSVVTGNFVCGDINVTGGVNLSCTFVGSSCVINGNRVLGMMVTTAAAKKNAVMGNIFTNSKAVQPGWPKVYPFSGTPDNSNEIAHNIINGSVI